MQVTVKSNGLHYELIYDGMGRMVATTSPSSVMHAIANRYLWCGERICQIRSKTNDVLRRYYSEGVLNVHYANNPLTTNISRYYYNRDHLGSVRDVQNIQTGNTAYSLDYDAYGNVVQSGPNTLPPNPAPHEFQYANMFYVGGLYLTYHRLYDPGSGRWLSRDPIGESGGVNLYTYVENNPVNRIDPDGRIGQVLLPAAIGGAGVAAIICATNPQLCRKAAQACVDGINKMFNEEQSDNENNNETKARQKSDRFKSDNDALQQLEDIERAQQAVRQGKSKQIIDQIDKSKQRANNALKPQNIDLNNLDDF